MSTDNTTSRTLQSTTPMQVLSGISEHQRAFAHLRRSAAGVEPCLACMRGRNIALPRLAILQEENEGGESKEGDFEDNETRPSKRLRVSLGSVPRDSEEGSLVVRKVRESRLIENMDISRSPLLARDNDASSNDSTESDDRVVMTTINPGYTAQKAEEGVQVPMEGGLKGIFFPILKDGVDHLRVYYVNVLYAWICFQIFAQLFANRAF
jgi:hypothetical protein